MKFEANIIATIIKNPDATVKKIGSKTLKTIIKGNKTILIRVKSALNINNIEPIRINIINNVKNIEPVMLVLASIIMFPISPVLFIITIFFYSRPNIKATNKKNVVSHQKEPIA